MTFDIEEFKQRLELEKGKGTNPAHYIAREVSRAEEVKVGLAEEANHATQFVSQAVNEISSYLFELHELAKDYPIQDFKLDQRTAIQDDEMQSGIRDQLNKLEDWADPNAPGKISPLDLS